MARKAKHAYMIYDSMFGNEHTYHAFQQIPNETWNHISCNNILHYDTIKASSRSAAIRIAKSQWP